MDDNIIIKIDRLLSQKKMVIKNKIYYHKTNGFNQQLKIITRTDNRHMKQIFFAKKRQIAQKKTITK